ncbi:MAG: hypothetical protein ACFFDN_42735 [Candidatus Hodarchaeota archaeon]
MKRKSKVLIIFLLITGYSAIGIFGGYVYIKNRQKEQLRLNMILASFIPAEFTIEMESPSTYYVSIIIGSSSFCSEISFNYIYHGSGKYAYAYGVPRWEGYDLTLRIRINGIIVSEKTSHSPTEKIECEAYSPSYYLLHLAFLI